MATADRSDATIVAELNDLLQLDHDAVEGYTIAIDRLRDAARRETLVSFRADHKRHIEELAALVRARGALPVELPHATGALKLAVQALGALGNDTSLLLAFKAVEGQVRDKYRRIAQRRFPPDAADVVTRAAADEERHYAWVEQTLREMGAGAGTLPHDFANAVEQVHRLIADPLEGAARRVMRDVGAAVGTTRSRRGPEAPSPADAARGAATSPNAGGAAVGGPDTRRFIDALRALEEAGDVEPMATLFDDAADVSNPMHTSSGAGGARAFWRSYRETFEEIRSEFSRVVESSGTAMLEWTSRGRLRGGREIAYGGVSVLELRDGRVQRFRSYFDTRPFELHAARPE